MKKEIIIGFLCFLIATSICVLYRSVNKYTTEGQVSVQSVAENRLKDRVLAEQENYEKLSQELQNAQSKLENLRRDSANNSDEAKKLEKELSELNRLLGYTDVKGKGIIIKLEDAEASDENNKDSLVHDLDLLDIVNELFNAGAEAISINGQRILANTAINCNGNVVRINNEKVGAPFVINAIGLPNGLYGAMTRPDGYLDLMASGKIKIQIDKVENDELVVPKYTGTIQHQYMEVAE